MNKNYNFIKLKNKTNIICNKTSKAINISISVFLCLCIILKLSIPVTASANSSTYYEVGHGNNVFTYSELLSKYKSNSITYKRNILDYQIQALNSNLADESHADINGQHIDTLGKIEELKQAREALIAYKNELMSQKIQTVTGSAITMEINTIDNNQELVNEIDNQIINIDLQLKQYNSTKSSLETSLSNAKLSRDISRFYANYQSLIENEARSKMENDFLKQCFSLIIYQEQVDYYKAYHEYLTLLEEIDTIRFRYGLVTNIDLDVNKVNISHNERVIDEKRNTYEASIQAIRRDTGVEDEFKLKLPLHNNKKEYKLEATIEEFSNKYSGYREIENYIRSYQEYRSNGNMGTYTSYRQTELRIDYYKLQKQELEDNIRAYVTQAIISYERAISSMEASWIELQVKSDQYSSLVTRLKYKRVSQLELAKGLYEKEAAEVAYYQSCYESVIWQDILDNHIYGATP